MRRIAIVGAAQAGLQLGLGLLAQGYHVTLTTNRTASRCALARSCPASACSTPRCRPERDLGLNSGKTSAGGGGHRPGRPRSCHPERPAFQWSARLERYAQAVDQRLKMPAWMEEFEAARRRTGDPGRRPARTGNHGRQP